MSIGYVLFEYNPLKELDNIQIKSLNKINNNIGYYIFSWLNITNMTFVLTSLLA